MGVGYELGLGGAARGGQHQRDVVRSHLVQVAAGIGSLDHRLGVDQGHRGQPVSSAAPVTRQASAHRRRGSGRGRRITATASSWPGGDGTFPTRHAIGGSRRDRRRPAPTGCREGAMSSDAGFLAGHSPVRKQ